MAPNRLEQQLFEQKNVIPCELGSQGLHISYNHFFKTRLKQNDSLAIASMQSNGSHKTTQWQRILFNVLPRKASERVPSNSQHKQ
jgi:hypothetical protein